jgi:hypothetical protein
MDFSFDIFVEISFSQMEINLLKEAGFSCKKKMQFNFEGICNVWKVVFDKVNSLHKNWFEILSDYSKDDGNQTAKNIHIKIELYKSLQSEIQNIKEIQLQKIMNNHYLYSK